MATLANGSKVVLTEATTSPIVVRGRSPRNFQARKEIPLLGSSAGSRGQALVETGMGIVAGPLTAKPAEVKPRPVDMNLPRTSFSFSGPKQMPQSPMGMRSKYVVLVPARLWCWEVSKERRLTISQFIPSAMERFKPDAAIAHPILRASISGFVHAS
jgi:hypothetical protein